MPQRRQIGLLLLLLLLAACQPQVPTSLNDVPRITAEEIKALQDAGKPVVLVDSRAPRQFERRRIPGAISIPARETEDHLNKLPPQATIVFY